MDYSSVDFVAKMRELIDMLKTMSSGYDPSVSSESDPLVVLLKEMGMSDDQIAYLIDKAVGELMPSRVQQRENAQELYESLGYNPKKYRSAMGNITLRLKNTDFVSDTITLPKFTSIGDANGQFEYVLLEAATWRSGQNKTLTKPVMEGKLKTLTVGGAAEIKLVNLDENYRIYFPEKNVAENGVFITIGDGEEEFERKDNIFALTNRNIYYIGEDENGEMYIQFPSMIVDLLGGGGELKIQYLVTQGTKGNCKAGTLTTVLEEIVLEGYNLSDNIIVGQGYSFNNGNDPESIDDMYRNFKKVQNKLEALVVEKDYEGAAFLAEQDRRYLWSNVIVASRLNDLNQTVQIKVLDDFQTKDYYRLIGEDNESEEGIRTSTLFVYGLENNDKFDLQFKPATATEVSNFRDQVIEEMAISQDIRLPAPAEKGGEANYGFLNEFFFSGMIMLKSSVNKKDADEIKEKVMQRLKYVYAARQRVFGKEIDYQEAVNTIINSDGRIQTVALSIPRYQIRKITADGGRELSTEDKIDLIARMVLRGNIQLFEHDERFDLKFGQVATDPIDNITAITTKAGNKYKEGDEEKDKIESDNGYTIQDNEVVQVKSDKYRTTTEYGYMVKYEFITQYKKVLSTDATLALPATFTAGSIATKGSTLYIADGDITDPLLKAMELSGGELKKGTVLAAGSVLNNVGVTEETTLPEDTSIITNTILAKGSEIIVGSKLVLAEDYEFVAGSKVAIGSVLTAGTTFEIGSVFEGEIVERVLEKDKDNELSAGEKLTVEYNDGGRIVSKDHSDDVRIRPSFDIKAGKQESVATGEKIGIREKVETVLDKGTEVYFVSDKEILKITENGGEYELGNREYLIYTNDTRDELVIINPGAILVNKSENKIELNFKESDIDTNNIDRENIDWVELKESIIIKDQEIFTFGAGLTVKGKALDGDFAEFGNNEELKIIQKGKIEAKYTEGKARIVLNVVGSEQELKSGQEVTVTYEDEEEPYTYTGGEDKYIAFNKPVVALGGEENKVEGISATTYEKEGMPKKTTVRDDIVYITKESLDANGGEIELLFSFYTDSLLNISMNAKNYGEGPDVPGFTITTGGGVELKMICDTGQVLGGEDYPTSDGEYNYQCLVEQGTSGIKITAENLSDRNFLKIGKIVPLRVEGDSIVLNAEDIALSIGGEHNDTEEDVFDLEDNREELLAKISEYGEGKYDYGYKVSSGRKVSKPTRSSNFWNPFHIGNKYTIAKLDLGKTKKNLVINPSQVV